MVSFDDVLLAVLAVLAITQPGAPQQPPEDAAASKSVRIVRIDKAPVIDGRLDEDVWSLAPVIEDLHQVQPNEFAPTSERTQIYLIYDDNALYIGARLWESRPETISAHILHQREFLGGDDHLGVIIDPFNKHRSGYTFIVSPNGVRVDGIWSGPTQQTLDWDGIYYAAATRDEHGWVAEMAIPFKTLSFDPNNDTWGINFFRVLAHKNERDAWVSRNRSQNPGTSGTVVGFTGLKQGVGLDVVPSVNLHRHDSAPSLDVFYKITPAMNAAATFNTDFSSTEVDDRQVNLTRFNLFFPEKRDFFLRDLDIFDFGGQAGFSGTSSNTAASPASLVNGRPFFSRRIGLSASGEPVDLEYGGKLSGRVGRWEVGAVTARQGRFGDIKPTHAFVGRATSNVLSESKVGFIATSGDPTANRGDTLVGADFQYVNTHVRTNHTVQGEIWFQHSDTSGLAGDDNAFGLGFHVPNNTGWRGGAGVKELQANFNPGLGFVNRRGIRDTMADGGYTYRWRSGYLRSAFAGADVERVEGVAGGLQSQIVSVRPIELQSVNGDQLVFRYTVDKEVLVRPFEISRGVVLPVGEYSFGQYSLDVGTGAQHRLAWGATFRTGGFYDGDRVNVGARMTWRPSKHFRAGLTYDINDVNLREGRFITRLLSFRDDVVLTNTLSWLNLIQFDNVSQVIGINSRIHWIPQDGREVFVVLDQNFDDVDRDHHFHSSAPADLTLKAGYTFRF